MTRNAGQAGSSRGSTSRQNVCRISAGDARGRRRSNAALCGLAPRLLPLAAHFCQTSGGPGDPATRRITANPGRLAEGLHMPRIAPGDRRMPTIRRRRLALLHQPPHTIGVMALI